MSKTIEELVTDTRKQLQTNRQRKWLELIEKNWKDIGECGSCSWHALFHEHNIDYGDINEALKNGGDMQVFCNGEMEDSIDHRGAKFNLYDLKNRLARLKGDE